MKVENAYVSCASNPLPTIASWGKNNLICFGSSNAVYIYNLEIGGGKIVKTLIKHQKKVTSVKWLSGAHNKFETEILSASVDGTAIVWSLKGDEYIPLILTGHESNVNIIDGMYRFENTDDAVVITASMDSTVRVWMRKQYGESFNCAQILNFKYGTSMAIALSYFPNTQTLILASATENNRVNLYMDKSEEEDKTDFTLTVALTGHENWVRGLDFMEADGALYLTTASQDSFVRLWKIYKGEIDDVDFSIYNTSFDMENCDYVIVLESILLGHENFVYSAKWSPNKNKKLVTASLDKTVIVWELDPQTGLWLESVRVGEVGGNTLGFYGGMFGPNDKTILAHSYHGAFHIWNYNEESHLWIPAVTVGGHFGEVMDINWEPKGEYLMSVSMDQTTRIHAPWNKDKQSVITWHEIARPQVHGYDFSSVAILSRYRFASSAEEKVIRAFSAPENFISNFKRLCNIEDNYISTAPKGASVPSLGLSNKAVYNNDNIEQAMPKSDKEYYPEESYFTAIDLCEPPTEETLIQNTLWPEEQKLYGHGYEVFCLASTDDGKYLASACKSTIPEHAAIIIWDTAQWKQVTKLHSHTLTVVQLSFSPDGKSLLSVSRDRRWSVFKLTEDGNWQIEATSDKKTGLHTRIIWSGHWSHDSKYFITGGRDGKAAVWTRNNTPAEGSNCIGLYTPSPIEIKGTSVTAVRFSPKVSEKFYLIALGFESGLIHLYKWEPETWTELYVMDKSAAHHLDVKKLNFRPVLGCGGNKEDKNENNIVQLASCSSDFSIRIYNIDVSSI